MMVLLKNTLAVSNFLKQNQIPATFFVVAQNIDLLRIDVHELYDTSLFEIGIHTFAHDDYSKFSYDEKNADIQRCLLMFKKHKIKARFFRPAYGIIDKDLRDILRKNNLKGVIWSIDSQDWNGLKGDVLVNKIRANLESGSIILFHDRISVRDLEMAISMIRKQGFKIVPLTHLMSCDNACPK